MGHEETIMRQWLDVCFTEGGLMVAQQKLHKRPLLVAQMLEEWLNHYRRIAWVHFHLISHDNCGNPDTQNFHPFPSADKSFHPHSADHKWSGSPATSRTATPTRSRVNSFTKCHWCKELRINSWKKSNRSRRQNFCSRSKKILNRKSLLTSFR